MKEAQPIKRHKALQPLSREHHHGLLLCWKINTGLRKKIEVERIKSYCDSFFTNQLLPHFEVEETHFYPILGKDHELVIQVVEQHRHLERLFKSLPPSVESMRRIADLLDNHIRFEERILFNKIQQAATAADLEKMQEIHPEQTPTCTTVEEWGDAFWE